MKKKNIFIASPIAGFSTEQDYNKYKSLIKNTVDQIKKHNGNTNIFCEIVNVASVQKYDSPAKSAIKDFNNIQESDLFILLYPQKVVSSALVELGYALSQKKKILIVSPQKNMLPYMVLGLEEVFNNVKLEICEFTLDNLNTIICDFISFQNE